MNTFLDTFPPGAKRFAQWLSWCSLSTFLAVGLAACGGGDDDPDVAVPAVTTQPASAQVNPGAVAVFSVVASGDALRNGADISGAVYSWSDCGHAGLASTNALAGVGQVGLSAGATVRAKNVDGIPFLDAAGIAAGETHSLAFRTDGTVWSWGNPHTGLTSQGYCPLGDGACAVRYFPVQVNDANGVPLTGAAQVSAGDYFSVAPKTDGTVWTWGLNNYGQLGDGTTTSRLNPVQVTDPSTGGFFNGVSRIAANRDHVVALKTNGTVWAWGRAHVGQIGDGSTAASVSVPKQVEVTPGVP